ncbi:MAG TPA: hypothetical protein VMI33_22485 [Streptosporangiaceae bacterium]|nr:hypothetical protein [Streptosporangiaceae bacterium]
MPKIPLDEVKPGGQPDPARPALGVAPASHPALAGWLATPMVC